MGNPLILYNLAPIVNPSFETSADGVFPAGWTDATPGLAETDDATAHERGSNEGTKSLKFVGTATGTDRIYQDITWAPDPREAVTGALATLTFMAKCDSDPNDTLKVKLHELNGSTELDTTSETFNPTQSWAAYSMSRVLDEPTMDGIRVEFNTGDSYTGTNFWVDYLHLGVTVVFDEPQFRDFQVNPQFRSVLNLGGGAYEGVELADPYTDFQGTIQNITFTDGLTTHGYLQDFLGWARQHKRFAFWLDQDDHTNEGHHFSECVLVGGHQQKHPPGAARYSTTLRFVAPREWLQQEPA